MTSAALRRWTSGDLVVLRTLFHSGETVGGLAARLRRPRSVIALKCAELMLTRNDDFLSR